MSEIADLTFNVVAFAEVMGMVWKRLNDSGKNWRHVYKVTSHKESFTICPIFLRVSFCLMTSFSLLTTTSSLLSFNII